MMLVVFPRSLCAPHSSWSSPGPPFAPARGKVIVPCFDPVSHVVPPKKAPQHTATDQVAPSRNGRRIGGKVQSIKGQWARQQPTYTSVTLFIAADLALHE